MITPSLATAVDPSPTLRAAFDSAPATWAMRIGVMLALLVGAFLLVRFAAARLPRPHPSADLPPSPPTKPVGRRTAEEGDATLIAASRLAEVNQQIDRLLARVGRMSASPDAPPDDSAGDDGQRTA